MRTIAVISAAALAAALAAIVAASAIFLTTRSDAAPPTPAAAQRTGVSEHGAAMDDAYASVVAMYHAPEGATPCESAHNAFVAEAEAAQKLGRESHFAFVAERAEFVAGCQALAPDAQSCLVPRYRARHRDACAQALSSVATLAHLFVEHE